MYLGTRITPIIVMVVVISIVVGGVILYNYMALQGKITTSTLTETTTITKYSTITITAGANATSTATLVRTTTATVTTTIPVTIIKTVTVTTLPPQPPKTTTTTTPGEIKGENFTVGNVQVYSTVTSIGLIGARSPKPMMLLKVPKNTVIEDIMSKLNQLINEGIQISSNMSVSISQAYDPAIVVMLPRGTPCTMYKVIVNDGNASDGRISLTIQKYSTSNYCIQVVPKDNLYVGIIVLRNLRVGQYIVDMTLDYGTSKAQYMLNISYS